MVHIKKKILQKNVNAHLPASQVQALHYDPWSLTALAWPWSDAFV